MALFRVAVTTGALAVLPIAAVFADPVSGPAGPAPPPLQAAASLPTTTAAPAIGTIESIVVTARTLVQARSEIETRIGATTCTIDSKAIQNQPGGADLPLNQTLLQVPGISQDSLAQIHLRNDHANIQYRIDGVILPEGISLFGQSLASRFASSIDVITGTLPAQYGLVTTGIVDIETRPGTFHPGGSVGVYGGSHGWVEPSAEYGGSSGKIDYYVAGDDIRNGLGIENPTRSSEPLHDATQQGHLLGYVEDILDDTSKITAIAGNYQGAFEIPDRPGQMPAFANGSRMDFNSAQLNEHQNESNDYAVLSYLKTDDRSSVQLSGFERFSRLAYAPDQVGDLMFYGLAQNAVRSDVAEGLQADGSLQIAANHTLRAGLLFTAERATSRTGSMVFPCATADCSSVAPSPWRLAMAADRTASPTARICKMNGAWRRHSRSMPACATTCSTPTPTMDR